MKKSIITILLVTFTHLVQAEDGHRLWLRQKPVHMAQVEAPAGSPTISIAKDELENYYQGSHVMLRIDPSLPG